ncbi:ArpU family phage packaging/lysis transcriptional regulator [Streptococcus suis]|uniref:ArpU family phage packaging/lysis transcriptional regulator n=1 Tax=Streptococcus suis TaxID=1307 RepID=UPI002FC887D2
MSDKIILKKLAKRKLEEFHRWCRVSNLFHEQTESFDNWLIPSLEFDPENFKLSKNSWQRKAPEEVSEIIKAVNAIARPRHRAILIMSYISPKKIQSAEQAQRLGIKLATYYTDKNKALQAFADLYRNGALLQYLDGEP